MGMKKIEMLRKLCDLKTKGYKLSKEYDFNSSIEEMEYEYALLKSFVDKRNGVKIAVGFGGYPSLPGMLAAQLLLKKTLLTFLLNSETPSRRS